MRAGDFLAYADAQLEVSAVIPAEWKPRADIRDAYRAGCLAEVAASMFRYLPDEEKAKFVEWYAVEASDA